MFDHMIRQNSRLRKILIKHGIMEESDEKLEGKHLNFIRNLINPPPDVEKVRVSNIYYLYMETLYFNNGSVTDFYPFKNRCRSLYM